MGTGQAVSLAIELTKVSEMAHELLCPCLEPLASSVYLSLPQVTSTATA